MCEVTIRRAKFKDIPQLDKLLFEVHKIHSDIRPDLFTVGEKKYTDEELERIIVDEQKPIFVAEHNGKVKGYRCLYFVNLKKELVKLRYVFKFCPSYCYFTHNFIFQSYKNTLCNFVLPKLSTFILPH